MVVLVASVALGLGACSSDASSSTTTKASTTTAATTTTTALAPVGSASDQLCAARETLRTSITDLSKVDVVKNGTSAITAQLDTIKTNLDAVRSAAGSDVQPQVDAFQTALDGLQTAVGSGGTPAVAAVVTSLRDVGTTGSTLLTSLGNLSCP